MSNVEIVIEGPGMNALGTPLMRRLLDELVAAGDAPILLRGAGKAFSAGLDLKEVASLDEPGMRAFLELLEALIVRLFHHPAPVVAAVNGHAIAGGAVLALCCDAAYGTDSDRARIGLNEVALGLQFPPAVLAAVRHRLDPRQQGEVLLGARLHRPEPACRLGLVDATSADPVAAAQAHLDRLAAHPPAAYAATKAALRGGVTDVDAQARRRFLEEVVPVWNSAETKGRLLAILGR
jgi:enoyl-CoA hydratase